MSFEQRKERALELLQATGMMSSHYAPPLTRLLWKAGINSAPPHFQSFLHTTVVMGSGFGILWGLFMWCLSRFQAISLSLPLPVTALGACLAGLLFGITMASIYAFDRRKHHLPAWSTLG